MRVLLTHHQQQYRNWEHSEDPAIIAFRRGLSLFTHEYADQTLYKHERYDHTTHNRQINHILQEHVIPKLIETTTPTERVLLPSLLSPLTSMAFHLPRTSECFRLDNQIFRTAIRRKLRLPLFHSNAGGRCRCNKELDKEGDHLFHCNQASKTALSNAVRDTLFDILRRAAPAAKTVDSLHDVHIEPPGLVPLHNRNIRPADVGLHLTQPHNNEPFQYVAIDVTIPPPQSRTPLQDPSDHTAIAKLASRTHNEAARAKYCRDPNTATHLLHNGIYLIPFTVDHLGSLGHFATRLLFHQDHPLPFSTAEPPDWKDPHFGKSTTRSNQHPAAFALYQNVEHSPENILAKANKHVKTTTYPFGLPLNGFESSSQETDEQFAEVGQWLWDEFHSFLKQVDIPGVDIFWNDNEREMANAEVGYLAFQSFALFPLSIGLVLAYLIIMQDSFFVRPVGMMQILLAFVPSLILYRYILGEDYLGVLNLISFCIILGIGVDDIFVFTDQFQHHHTEPRFDQRMQKTFNVAARAMFTTSCTTFISFLSSATSVFPAVSTFGIFSAFLVAVNYCAVTTFSPAVYAVYYTRFRTKAWDRPSQWLAVCLGRPLDVQEKNQNGPQQQQQGDDQLTLEEQSQGDDQSNTSNEGTTPSETIVQSGDNVARSMATEEQFHQEEQEPQGHQETHASPLVQFFGEVWAPWTVTYRVPIVVVFAGILGVALYFASQLTPDEDAPSTLPDGNQYKEQPGIV